MAGLGALAPSLGSAAIVETIINTDTTEVVGSITFPDFTGTSKDGVLFSLDGFSQSDITSIDWTLDPSTEAVADLDLEARQGDTVCPTVGPGSCSFSTLTVTPSTAAPQSFSCETEETEAFCQGFGRVPDNIAFVPTPVPEPATWLLGLTGFVGLGAWRLTRGRLAKSAA